jgi:hypothetical protein
MGDMLFALMVGSVVAFATAPVMVRYEDTNAVGGFGLSQTRVVRLAAVKP